jgi:hypothetical protein
MSRLLVLLAVVLGSACATEADDALDTVSTTEPSTTPEASEADPSSRLEDLAIAKEAATEPADLPGGWVECCEPQTFDEASLDEHICGSPEGLPPHTAGYMRQYAYNLQPDGTEDGHLTSTVLVAPTAEAAGQEWQAVDSPGYEQCLIDSVQRGLREYYVVDPERTELSSTYERIDLDLPVPAIADRLFTTVVGPDGEGGGGVLTFRARALADRAIVRIEITMFVDEMPVDTVAEIVGGVVRRARAG